MKNDFVRYEKDKIIDDKKSRDFVDALDYSLKTEQERIELVEKILYDEDGMLNDYLVKVMTGSSGGKSYINVTPNSEEPLSENVAVFKNLEILASYIINAPTADRLTYQQEYKFYRDRRHFEDAVWRESLRDKDCVVNKDGENCKTLSESEVIDFYLTKRSNFKKSMDTKITTKDKKNIPEVRELEQCILRFISSREKIEKEIELIKSEIVDKITEEQRERLRYLNGRKYKLNVAIGDMRQQQRDYKELILKPLRFKNPLPDSHDKPRWDLFDFFDEKHVEALLYTNRDTVYNDYRQELVESLKKYLKHCDFNQTELYILQEVQKGCPLSIIANNLNLSPSAISRRMKTITKEIIKQHELFYSDWYYTFVVKGNYEECFVCGKNVLKHRIHHGVCHECKKREKKICEVCGDIKGISDFGRKKKSLDGHKDTCKECEKKAKNVKSLDEMITELDKKY